VDDRSGPQEQERLEEGVGHQVEDRSGERPDACPEEHVAELGDGGVREHLLDVVLREADRGREQRVRAPTMATAASAAGAFTNRIEQRATM